MIAGIAGAAIAAGLFLAITIGNGAGSLQPAGGTSGGVATITRLARVRWTSGTRGWRELSRVGPGDILRFDNGEVEVVFDHGVEVVIRGPAHFEVRAPDRAYSSLGRIAARVGKDGEGFTIETPVATVNNLLCGDAYIVQGQSNAEATAFGDDELAYFSSSAFILATHSFVFSRAFFPRAAFSFFNFSVSNAIVSFKIRSLSFFDTSSPFKFIVSLPPFTSFATTGVKSNSSSPS